MALARYIRSTSPAPVRTRPYKRSPFAAKGFPQFQRNMADLAKLGNSKEITAGFNQIGGQMRDQMEATLRKNLNTPTSAYIKSKKGKAMYLRNRGLVAKPYIAPGQGKSFVAVDYRYGPHAHFFETGTGPRYTRKRGKFYRGMIPREGSKKFRRKGVDEQGRKVIRLGFFRPVVNEWRRSGRYQNAVKRVVTDAVTNRVLRYS